MSDTNVPKVKTLESSLSYCEAGDKLRARKRERRADSLCPSDKNLPKAKILENDLSHLRKQGLSL